ncbi:MAG: DUF494 family protein [Legionellaceae bacterium]|nr:DUF494 family protein [Legionellaceae bacterium]
MKDNWLQQLMHFFQDSQVRRKDFGVVLRALELARYEGKQFGDLSTLMDETLPVQPQKEGAIRVLSFLETSKLTAEAYQFLMRMIVLPLCGDVLWELIFNQLLFSSSRIVSKEEVQSVIRSTLEENLSYQDLVFLDLVLYVEKAECTSLQ